MYLQNDLITFLKDHGIQVSTIRETWTESSKFAVVTNKDPAPIAEKLRSIDFSGIKMTNKDTIILILDFFGAPQEIFKLSNGRLV